MPSSFGELVFRYRKQLGWTQTELARHAGLSDHSIISKIETGTAAPLEPTRKIVTAFDQTHKLTLGQLRELAIALVIPTDLRDKLGETPIVAMLVPGVGFSYSATWAELTSHVERYLKDAQLTLVLCQHDNVEAAELDYLRRLCDAPGLKGILMAPVSGMAPMSYYQRSSRDDVLDIVRKRRVPVIFLDLGWQSRHPIPYVGMDDYRAGFVAGKYLLDRGHRTIGVLLGLRENTTQQNRLAGFLEATRRHGIDIHPKYIRYAEEVAEHSRAEDRKRFGYRRGRRNAIQLLSMPEEARPTALFCGNNYMAIEALNATRYPLADGTVVKVPDDVSILGIDDVPHLDLVTPALARVPLPIADMAFEVVQKLRTLIDNPEDPVALQDTLVEPPAVIEGASVTPPRQTVV